MATTKKKVVTKKKTVKKTVVKKAPKKTPAPKRKKAVTTKKKQPVKVLDEVTIPTNVSARTRSKADAIATAINDELHRPMFYIAYVSAVCFMLVGFTLILPNFIDIPSQQTAQVCSDSICTTQRTNDTSGATEAVRSNEPTVKLLDSIPEEISSEARIVLAATDASSIAVKIQSLSTGGLYDAPIEKISNGNYRFKIPANSLPSGKYSVKILAKSNDNTGTFSFPVGVFVVPGGDIDTSTDQVISDIDSIGGVTNATVKTDFSLVIARSEFVGLEAVRINAPKDVSSIEIYIRPELSLQSRFLGLAEKNYDRWLLTFDSKNIPNGEYQIFATGYEFGTKIETEALSITINNTIAESRTTTGTDNSTDTQPGRNFYIYEEPAIVFERSVSVDTDVSAEVDTLFSEDVEKITALFERYAVSIQSDDSILKELAEEELTEYKDGLVTKTLLNPETKDLSHKIDIELQSRFTDLQNRVKTFETIREARNNVDLTLDTDGDGISDFDETEVYHTNPDNPDSDNDGFLDGAEIIRGFNPNDDTAEVIVDFELPQTLTGLSRPELLEVVSVTPFVLKDESSETTIIQTEIKGIGLPNSFVTLYIFSSPIIVTVKTDADGSFVYKFDKELEDGEHEVFVAFTDNTGAILAHSNSFQFVKEAQAFTPVDASEEVFLTNQPITETVSKTAYSTVVGFGILAFGLILLLLGISIRPNSSVKHRSLTTS